MVSSHLRDQHLARLCDSLSSVESTSSTLCAGWDAHDLAVHLWVLKRDPLSWPGIIIPALAGTTERRAGGVRRRWDYESLVSKLRLLPGSIACMPLDRWEGHRHALGEYYIHTEDVRRANGLHRQTQTSETEDALWIRARTAGRQLWMLGRATVEVTSTGRDPFVLGRGVPTTQVSGLPSEVILWIYGREAVAEVVVTRTQS